MRKMLILTASPQRDLPIDEMLASKLRAMGNEVAVSPCLREGRGAVLEYQPNVVVMPPIRNRFSADMVEQLKKFGCGVVSRHTEPSLDWSDWKRMNERERASIWGMFPYAVDVELVWGPDEAQILNRRTGAPFKAVSVGSFSADTYKDPEIAKKYLSKEGLYKKHNLDLNKKTILILCAWGFLDSAPDLHIDENDFCTRDKEGREMWLAMIKVVHETFKDSFNVLVTLHPNVAVKPYKDFLAPLGIPLDTELKSKDLVPNCDVVIHAGSTSALGAHFLDKPAFQYGDQNRKQGSWWNMPESVISQVSPFAPTVEDLVKLIQECEFDKSNASLEAIDNLENGRYGLMDGKATDRAAEIINKIEGEFKYFWPEAPRDYSQPLLQRYREGVMEKKYCNICKHFYYAVRLDWLETIRKAYGIEKPIVLPLNIWCPWCATKFYVNRNEAMPQM